MHHLKRMLSNVNRFEMQAPKYGEFTQIATFPGYYRPRGGNEGAFTST